MLITTLISGFAMMANPASRPLRPLSDKTPSVRVGKYQVQLRLPDEGLFAGEETDVEFRVTDTTQKDPVEEGFKGVGGIDASAIMTMPSMAGMPSVKPSVHREGVPGDYGVVLFFPHGGEYQLDLSLKVPGGESLPVKFKVDVKDERTTQVARPLPYQLKLIPTATPRKANQRTRLTMQVVDNKTKQVQTKFDVAHEQQFHLLIVSKDLNWFVHEHPVMDAKGNWTYDMMFPAGGTYYIFGDVAPSGKGSQILRTSVEVSGSKPTWNRNLVPNLVGVDRGLKGIISSLEAPIPIGTTTTMQVKLFDTKTGMPVGDTVKWLGAAGHLMIFHADGKTVVHSHPQEDAESEALTRKGLIRFNARFPKAGLYKAYAQVKWHGSVHTIGFTLKVQP